MKTESINPFNEQTEPEQFARYEKIVAAVQAGKTDKELWAEFKVGPKSIAEIRAKLNPPTAPSPAPEPPAPATVGNAEPPEGGTPNAETQQPA